MSSEYKIVIEKRIEPTDNVELVVNGEPVYFKIVNVQEEKNTGNKFEDELKEAYLAVKEDRREVMKEWNCTIADGLKNETKKR